MEARLIIQGKNDPPQLTDVKEPIFDFGDNPAIIFSLIEGGMASGEPSVMIVSENEGATIVLQTSLDKFLAAGAFFMASAESKWGWKRPEGYATLVPPSSESRLAILEAIKKELEEWENVDKED